MYVSQVDNEDYMHSHETTCMEDDATGLGWRVNELPAWWVMS